MKKKKGISGGKMLAVGAGVAALGAGAYLLLGPDGKKNRKAAGKMISKVKKEIKKDVMPVVKKAIKKAKQIEKKAQPKFKYAIKAVKKIENKAMRMVTEKRALAKKKK